MNHDTAELASELRALYPAFEGLREGRLNAVLEHAQVLLRDEHGGRTEASRAMRRAFGLDGD